MILNVSIGLILGITIPVVLIIIIIAIVIWYINTYNKLVTSRNRVKNQWAQIDVQLKRRFDLIPNLLETVKGYTKHEGDLIGRFAEARKSYATAQEAGSVQGMASAANELSKALNIMVNAVRESYPELKADAQFNQLMSQLKEAEDKIAYQRQFYNDCVLSYNNLREIFPSSIVANHKKFEAAALFEVTASEEREAPKVSF